MVDFDFNTRVSPLPVLAVAGCSGGTHDDWDGYDQVMAEQRRAAVFIHAARTAGNG